ncbi:succinate dehydrogenase [Elioraea sp.]|uniref:succinate dehydrogenase n=1 Tax=Elioraea sp. TaxID=2185103 RepID=UPI003F6ECAE8
MMRGHRNHPGWWAALAHRLSGLSLAVFLPLHFLVLGTALGGAAALDRFLDLTTTPLAKIAETGIVLALALHLALGLRVLHVEFLPRPESRTRAIVASCFGAGVAVTLLFLLNLTA